MSLNLITYEGNSVTHKHDGAMRQALTPDCILTGCTMSYSGAYLTIQKGYMLIAGREVYLDAATPISVPTTAAYALVKVTISESGGSVAFAAAASSSASPSVGTQGAINATGTTYSALIAVVSISSGAITGIVNKIRKAAPLGRIYGTAATPADTDYVDGTEYIQYEA